MLSIVFTERVFPSVKGRLLYYYSLNTGLVSVCAFNKLVNLFIGSLVMSNFLSNLVLTHGLSTNIVSFPGSLLCNEAGNQSNSN